ncbi:hypothetical protein J113_21600 [Mycobacterium tuberculosis CAS/NITR204]|uniref:Uncharacterized protein n=1 Tax=Mycobacterium tuberculosis CAS/NITR204 TaxID=1310114 RepID=R4MKQ7_MYCTX|nr:hypothetical protein J113_21600 [Mycobacterium tuberculosis CAS/NITR204]
MHRHRLGAPQRPPGCQLRRRNLTRHGGAQQAGLAQPGHQLVWQPTIALDFRGSRSGPPRDLLGEDLDLGFALVHGRLLMTVAVQ